MAAEVTRRVLPDAERGCLLLADISGYTTYLTHTELEHAQDVLADLTTVITSSLEPVLHVVEVEGDAVFAYVLAGELDAGSLLDTIDTAYFWFRARARDVAQGSTCQCGACSLVPSLDLKFVVHDGRFVLQEIAGKRKPAGPDVVLAHRLLKNHVSEAFGLTGYALLTQACTEALSIDPAALGLHPHVERYDDVGEVVCHIEDLQARWESEKQRRRVYVLPADAQFSIERTLPATPVELWELSTEPSKRMLWHQGVTDINESNPGGRRGLGSTAHCLHGSDVMVEEILDWQPYRYFTRRSVLPMIGPWAWTFEFAEVGDGQTQIRMRGEPLRGKARVAWTLMRPMMMRQLNHNFDLLEQVVVGGQRPANSRSTANTL
ncbi:MAG TPA: DUF2652 domain-containing protein [Egibacteraceae bacterium]|nr:DUF2652 domain-containing protein [Egibacteraceae bacterium]